MKNSQNLAIIYIESERESNSSPHKKKLGGGLHQKGIIMKNEMTRRDFFNAIAKTETLSDELRAFAEAALVKMDETNAKRAAKPSKTAIENAPLITAIVEMLGDEPKTATDLAEPMGVKVQKASALLRAAVKEGKAVSHDVKIKGKGTQKGYTRA